MLLEPRHKLGKCMASTKNEISTIAQANSRTVIWMKFSKKLTNPINPECPSGNSLSHPNLM